MPKVVRAILEEPPEKRKNGCHAQGGAPGGLGARLDEQVGTAHRQWCEQQYGGVEQAPLPGPGEENGTPPAAGPDGQGEQHFPGASRVSRVSRVAAHAGGLLAKVYAYLALYVALPEETLLAVSAWVMAAWLAEQWDRFPHLGITSPAERSGKTRLLELLCRICPKAELLVSSSTAAIYRGIALERPRPTLLLDEAQSLGRRGSERSEELRELFCGSIGKDAVVKRCVPVGNDWQIRPFPTYCPKVFALIGSPDRVLADRSLPVPLKRKTAGRRVRRCRLRLLEPHGGALRARLEGWAASEEVQKKVAEAYTTLEPFDIDNDRMAELLLPLQAVLHAEGQGEALRLLEAYARGIEAAGREAEAQSPGVRLLAACRDVFTGDNSARKPWAFVPTDRLIADLTYRPEEPWHRWNDGHPISPEKLAGLLRPYGIKSRRGRDQTRRGYFALDFKDAWERYLPHPAAPMRPNPANPANLDGDQEGGRP